MFALMAFCTHSAWLPDRATDRVAYKKPKVQKITEITELCRLYL